MSSGDIDHLANIDDLADRGGDAVIDVVLVSADGDEYVLVLAEERRWDEPGVIDHLTDRVNRTVAFVLEGRLAAEMPESVGRRVRVDIRYEHPPTPDVEALFLRCAAALSQRGMELTAEPLGPALPGRTDA
jgi:hypothetical protein